MNFNNGVIVVGSLHYDIFLNASHQLIKGETIFGNSWYPKFGGKGGNQAVAASLYGCMTKIISAVGDDEFGKYILEKISNTKVIIDYIQIKKNVKSGMSVAISDNEGEYGAIVVSGANLKIDSNIFEDSLLWKNSKILMIQNEVEEKINIIAAKKAKLNGLKICLNASPPKKLSSELLSNIDILIVNKFEAEKLSGKKISDIYDAKKISKLLLDQFELVVITTGENGVVVCKKNHSCFSIPAKKITVESTHGAGDMFAGTLCAALASNVNLKKAIQLANEKSAIHVSKKK